MFNPPRYVRWFDLYADLYRQVFGAEVSQEKIIADLTNRGEILQLAIERECIESQRRLTLDPL